MPIVTTTQPPPYLWTLATQQDASLVAAMAERAQEDGTLIEGAELTEREARALFALEDEHRIPETPPARWPIWKLEVAE